jgi:hypothetical protein
MSGAIHCHFKSFLEEVDRECSELLYHCKVRSLSHRMITVNILMRAVFMEMDYKAVPEL